MDQFRIPAFKKPSEEASVKIARNRFKNVLKHMVQDNLMHDEESDSDTDDKLSGLKNMGVAYASPKNGTRLKPEGSDQPKPQATFVMKLFDRGVDLAQFDERTPLYPICRAWIHNKPQLNAKKLAAEKEPEEDPADLEYREEGSEDIFRLPPPEPLPIDEYGNPISIRIPPPLPRMEEDFNINYSEDEAPSPALLFQNHLDRWNLIRQRWKEATAYNERRYEQSFDILKQIHERVKQDESAANQMNQVNLESVLQQQDIQEDQEQEQVEEQEIAEQE